MTVQPTIRVFASSRNLSTCRGCKQNIYWAEVVESGRRICFDRLKVLEQTVDDATGRAVLVVDQAAVHWATCPDADRFRRKA